MTYVRLPLSANADDSADSAPTSAGPGSIRNRLTDAWEEAGRKKRWGIALGVVAVLLVIIASTIPSEHDPLASTKAAISHSVQEGWETVSKWTATHISSSSSGADGDDLDDFAAGDGWNDEDDYYRTPGLLQFNKSQDMVHRRVRYLHVDDLEALVPQNKTGLEAEIKLGDGFDVLETYSDAVWNRKKEAAEELNFLNNKTILAIGDSVDRYALDTMCRHIFRGDLSYRNLHLSPDEPLLRPVDPKKVSNYYAEFSEPHHCHLTDKTTKGALDDFQIWSLMIYGVVSGEKDWVHKDQTQHPRLWSDKIDLFAPALKARGVKPDMIVMNSLLWDLADFNLRDAKAEVPAREALSLAQVEEFRQKTLAFLDKVNEHWPDATKLYRKQHEGKSTPGTWYLQGLNPMPKSIAREPYSYNKVNQLNEVIENIVLKTQGRGKAALHSFPFRRASQDYTKDFHDEVHPGNTGNILYTQMLMYYMKKFSG